jgi:hypothetical protein
MIIVQLKGGLGNQLFQYAAGRQLSEKFDVPLKFDLSFLNSTDPNQRHIKRYFELDKFKIIVEIATESEIQAIRRQRWKNSFKPVWIRERKNDCHKKLHRAGKDCYLNGFFQSEKYFINISETIRNELIFKEPLTDRYFLEIKEQIENSNSVSLHFRRGDYVENPNTNRFHGVCPLEYYRQAVKWMNEKTEDQQLFVFSDDIGWVKANFRTEFPTVFVEKSEEKLHSDFRLMSLCKHNIIANSSYSWWAAWLNLNEAKTIIAPEKWFANARRQSKAADIIPGEWYRI